MHPLPLRIGWATRNATPSRSVNLRGQFHMRITSSVHDPVTVTALAISAAETPDPANTLIWVSCDTLAIPFSLRERARALLAQRLPGFPTDRMVLNATHTHAAPDTDGGWALPVPDGVMRPAECAEELATHIADAAAESWSRRTPGRLAWGMADAPIARGRRVRYLDALPQRPGYTPHPGMMIEHNARMYGRTRDPAFDCIEGYADPTTHFLFTFNAANAPTGAVVNVACTAQISENLGEISADFWHETRCELRRRHGPALYVLPQCSAAGGLSPRHMFHQDAHQRMLTLRGISQRQETAEIIADAFTTALDGAVQDVRDAVVIRHSREILRLPRRPIQAAEAARARADLAELEARPRSTAESPCRRLAENAMLHAWMTRCRRVIARAEIPDSPATWDMELHAVRIGDVAWVTNDFELFADYGIRIQARSPALQTFVVQHCGPGTYLATRLAEQGGGYSASPYCNEVGPEGGDALVNGTVAALESLWNDADPVVPDDPGHFAESCPKPPQ